LYILLWLFFTSFFGEILEPETASSDICTGLLRNPKLFAFSIDEEKKKKKEDDGDSNCGGNSDNKKNTKKPLVLVVKILT
jgi:hypothetical protein